MIVNFGSSVLKGVLHINLPSVMNRVHSGGEFDTAVRLLDNTWRAVAGVVTWIVLWVIVLIPWQLLSAVFHSSHPHLARAIVDIGGALMSFVLAGFCLYLIRMAVALALAQSETRRAYARVGGAMLRRGGLSTASPTGMRGVAVALTTPTDFDFVIEALVAGLVLIALVGHAHSQGYPLVVHYGL